MKVLEINKEDLVHNINVIKKLNKVEDGLKSPEIIAVVKGNAYGLGLIEVSKILNEQGIEFLAVATVEEALELRQNGIKCKILMLSSTGVEEDIKNLIENDIILTVGSKEVLEAVDKEEVEMLLDAVETGTKLTKSQQAYHNYTKTRDFAIICLLLGTGMRVSECVGINIEDVDFYTKGIKILRKGGNESIVYFGDEVYDALSKYFDEREEIEACEGHEDALFLSMQRKRISTRTVQNLVKKYAKIATPLKNISPHKLRSTYGTALYEKTEDIYLVADALGHADINTTKKHYAKMHEQRRKQAALVTKLREDK